jgi:hypothetical protein
VGRINEPSGAIDLTEYRCRFGTDRLRIIQASEVVGFKPDFAFVAKNPHAPLLELLHEQVQIKRIAD